MMDFLDDEEVYFCI